MNKNTDPRYLALRTLMDAEKRGRSINLAADAEIKCADMSAPDTSLYTTLVYGVTERRITLDYIIDAMASRGGSHIEPRVRCILRLGLYQLCYMDKIPPHAAVNETVSLCKNKGESSFVNAILRNYQRDGETRVKLPSEETEPLTYLSVKYSFPEWICASFVRDYGYDNAKGILEAFSAEPPAPTLRINTLKTSAAEYEQALKDAGVAFTEAAYAPNGLRLADGVKISELVGYDDGAFFVQDEASQISTEVLGVMPGQTVVDVCSCPGSKSFGAAITMQGNGRIYSFDLHDNKLSLVKRSAERLGIGIIETRELDGRRPDPSLFGQADCVICDVPCSGLGVMAKKPDIRYKNEQDVERLAPLGLEILSRSADYVRAGGTLLYSTCTLRRDENEAVVEAFLASDPGFTLCPFSISSKDEARPSIDSNGMLTLMPHVHGTDGFFIAKMKKLP